MESSRVGVSPRARTDNEQSVRHITESASSANGGYIEVNTLGETQFKQTAGISPVISYGVPKEFISEGHDTDPFDKGPSKYAISHDDYEFVRWGEPNGGIRFDKYIEDRTRCINRFLSQGYKGYPSDLSPMFRRHLCLFRAALDIYHEWVKNPVFTRDELYYRCLSEGPQFTEKVKKMRSTCLRALSAETDTEVEEEYFSELYTGYNSIFSERLLIHWDDRDQIDDYLYSLIPTKLEKTNIGPKLRAMFKKFHIENIKIETEVDMVEVIKNSVMYDISTNQTGMMKEFWKFANTSEPYIAKRTVVLTEPGSTRDTGIGTPGTIAKVKTMNKLARLVSEILPYSANCPADIAQKRYDRVLKRHGFLHLDFKKYGLTFPRLLQCEAIKELCRLAGIDPEPFYTTDFYLIVDGEPIITERGTVLGWFDAINYICVAAILDNLINRGLPIDFIGFNDDLEIGVYKDGSASLKDTLEMVRDLIILEMSNNDILVSLSKTYGSRASVFLERYNYFTEEYDLDMYKLQLTIKAYSRSMVATWPWRAKLLYAAASEWTPDAYCRDRCIDTIKPEFRPEEVTLPLLVGGWHVMRTDQLDQSLTEADDLSIRMLAKLSKFKMPNVSKRIKKRDGDKIHEKAMETPYHATGADLVRLVQNFEVEKDDINVEDDHIIGTLELRATYYEGNTDFLSIRPDYPRRLYKSSGVEPPPD
jgi:hypothetical protein